jgi:ribosomal protein L13E
MSEKAARKAPAKKTGAKKAASKRTSSKSEKEVVAVEAVKAVLERGPAPVPVVLVRHERGMQERRARGYSLSELGSAGITFIAARKVRLPVDIRRRSVLDGNVSSLKGWYLPEPKKPKPEAAEAEAKAEKPARKKAPKAKRTTKAKKE